MDIIKLLQRAYRAYRRKKNWQRVVRAMAMVVVFCTTYALILPAITMESGTICGLTEHTHTDACYVAVTEPEAHTHTGECYEKSLVCALDESEGHNHSDSCNGIIEKLICTADHEEHVGTCYSYETGLVCGLEESEGHSHGDACWESKLICGLEEAVEETTEATEETTGETTGETEEAVKRELVCGLEEHTHDESCYPVTEPETTENISASVDADPEADLETQEDWEASLSGVSLTGDWSVDLLAIAASQLGYTESQSNYITDENGQTFHYTRYGQWYSAPYGDWSAMFVSFCLRYAQVEGIPADQDCQNLLNVLRDEEIYLEKGQYAPVAGDLIFLDKNADGVCDAVGIVEEIVAATEEAPEMVRFLAGDWEGRVERVTMEAQDVSVLGYAVLPTEPDDTQEHTFAGEDGMSAQVALDALTTAVPEDAVLTIEAVTEADEEYAAMTEQVEALVEKEILDITMLDISFYDAQGEYIGVGESASVSLTFPGDAFGGNAVKVFHFTEDGPTELSGVSYYYEYETAEDGTETMQTVLSFNTEGFSVFAITNIQGEYEVVTVTDTAQLDGNTFYIVNGNRTYIMQDTMATGGLGLEKVAYSQDNLKTSTTWTFIKQEDGTFQIRSDSGSYVKMADENRSNGYTTVSLTEANDEADATNFTISVLGMDANGYGAYIDIGYNGPNNGFHYLNVYNGNTDFRGWKDPGTQDSGSRTILYMAKESSGTIQTVNGLDGKEFAIVSNVVYNGYNKSLATTQTQVNNGQGLITIDTQQVVIDGTNCVDGEAVLWKFEKTETEGEYYISTTVDGNKKYLRMLDTHQAATPDGRGSLTLGDQPQPITVIANDDGTVSLSATVSTTVNDTDYTVTGYVNLDAAAYNFWTYKQNVDSCKLLLCQKSDLDSSFGLRYGTYTIRFNLQDVNGNKLYSPGEDKEVDATASVIFSDAGFAPEIDGYVLAYATYEDENGQTFTVKSLGPAGTLYRIYDADYDETNNPNLFHTMDRDSEITLVYRVDVEPILYYNFNYDWKGDGWVTGEPGITDDTQTIATDPANLYKVSGRNAAGKFIRDTIHPSERAKAETYWTQHNNSASVNNDPTKPGYLPPGAEYQFLYWVANNTNGEECHFPEGAEVYLDDAGYIRIKDTEGNWQTVWPGTTLRGEWDMLSNVIFFFVNHGDTMLEGEDNQTITSTNKEFYTEIAAIGHIYNLNQLSHDDHYAADGTIKIATHEEIEAILAPVYDPNSQQPQIVIDAVTKFDSSAQEYYEEAPNYNEALLETAVALYIQSQNNKTIKLDGAILDKSMITPENYKLYWYGLKLVDTDSDAYHMDGVLVAKTDPVYIYKTFSGLQNHMQADSQAITLISRMQFPLYLLSKNSDGVWTRDSYTTLLAEGSQAGVYEADGWQRDSSNIYQWTLQMVKGQTYALEEINHELAGYDCLSLISVHYNDESETVVYQYNTTKTFKDIEDGTDNVPIEDLFNNGVDSDGNQIDTEKGIVGGKVKSITFANFYTTTGTGMFSISKTADDAGQVRLPGATFALKGVTDSSFYKEIVTNEYGSAHFSDLSVGTYILSEVAPPLGYQKLLYEGTTIPVTWTVTVTQDENSKITVTIWENDKDGNYSGSGTVLYDQEDSRIKVYQIKNEPVDTTVEVNKYFVGITTAEVQSLYDNYYISVLDSNGTEIKQLTLNDAHPMAGQLYNWTLELPEGTYTFEEHNFLYSQAYLDTMVTVTTDGGCIAGAVVKSDSTPDNGSAEHDLATFTVTKGGAAGTVNITNSYTNEFILRIHKVDATNGNTGMKDVVFKIFGDFEQATGTETMTYKDANGVEHTVYLVKTLETDSNGYAQYDEMRLSSGSRTFLYVISEVSTPAGYVALTDPIVKVVSIDSENYSNGVYDLEIENFEASKVSANVSITAKKEWDLPSGLSPTTIKLYLYQKDSTGAITDCGYVELNGTKTGTGTTTEGSQNVSYTIGIDGWTVTWTGLTYATSETRHEYYVVEAPMAGYHTTYSYPESIYVNGELTAAGRAVGDKQLERSVTITNTSGYALPETGGAGTRWMAPLGLMLILAAAAMYWLGIEKKKQGGVDSS